MEEHIKALFKKYLSGETTRQDLVTLYQYFNIAPNEALLEQLIKEHLDDDLLTVTDEEEHTAEAITNKAWENIMPQLQPVSNQKTKPKIFVWSAVAAILIGSLFAAMYFLMVNQQKDSAQFSSIYGSDVLPATNKATLILSDGRTIELDSASTGIQIVKGKGIAYQDGATITEIKEIGSAELKVPNGGIYRLTLPDGSKVVLNSGSSITYPIQFADSVRLVKLEGEAYFEVTKDAHHPFKVEFEKQVLTVLGTHFNIQTYPGEITHTTLLEGKVSLSSGTIKTILSPGQQATIQGTRYKLQNVPAEEYIGWARNLFVFNNLNLEQIGNQLERWYDVQIIWPESMLQEQYLMEIPRDRKLSEVLSSISEVAGISFKIEGRRVTAIKK